MASVNICLYVAKISLYMYSYRENKNSFPLSYLCKRIFSFTMTYRPSYKHNTFCTKRGF